MSMSFKNEGQGMSGQFEGISLSIALSKYKDNSLTNKKVIKWKLKYLIIAIPK